jgi:predicted phage tail protein
MKESLEPDASNRTAAVLAILVIGIALNTLGVTLVALRGVGWLGFLLMLTGIGMLLFSVVQLSAEARRKKNERDPAP